MHTGWIYKHFPFFLLRFPFSCLKPLAELIHFLSQNKFMQGICLQ